MRAHIIANPAAGRGTAQALGPPVAELLKRHGWSTSVTLTGSAEHAREAAAGLSPKDFDAVVAVGGDGLINDIINGPLHEDIALGVVPCGTGNVLARELGLPLRCRAATEALTRASVARFDLGEANGRRFVLMCGIGWDAQVAEAVGRAPRPSLGIWQYVPAIARLAWHPERYLYLLEADGRKYESPGWLMLAANTNLYTWHFRPTPKASPTDGVLHLALLRGEGSLAVLKAFAWSVLARELPDRDALHLTAATVEVRTVPAAPYQLDGDRIGLDSVRISVLPRALRVLTPADHPFAGRGESG